MDNKVKVLILTTIIIVAGFLIYETANGTLINLAFGQISYNHTAYASIPNDTKNGGSLGGFYSIYGQGNKFQFDLAMAGAENFEDPLCYTKDGLKGNGTIDSIQLTFNTIQALINRDVKKAMFETPVTGHFEMKCAAWTGYGNFSNNGTFFPGYFKIDGPATDWEGAFKLTPDGNKIAIQTSYIWYPHLQKVEGKIKQVNKTYYM